MPKRQLLLALALALTVASGCESPSSLGPTDGDVLPERALTGDSLRASWTLEGGWYTSLVLDAPTGATRVGTLIELEDGAAVPALEARGLDADGQSGPWLPLEVTWRESDQLVARVDLEMDAFGAQLRMDASEVASVVWSAVVPANQAPRVEAAEVGSVASPLRSDLAAIGVVSRSEWGARSGRGCAGNTDKYRMAIHHTVTPATSDPGVRLRGIQSYHMDSNGWCDIGYHFLVSLDGRMWEGRPLEQLGTHVGNHNTGNVGISFIGCFHSSGCNDWTPFTPPAVMLDAGATLVREMSRIYGITVNATNVKGHRDHAGATSSCPGDNLHALLPDIRARASGPSGPVWSAQYVGQSFPLASADFVIPAGEERSGTLEMRNTGTDPWTPGATFLGTTSPRDGASAIAGSDWISPSRAATVDRVVPPGETGTFAFSVRAPWRAGEYAQYFNLVQEGVAWFDPPGDEQLQIRVTVAEDGVAPMGDGGVADGGLAGDGGGEPDLGPTRTPVVDDGGCGCRVAGTPNRGPSSLGWLLLAPLALTIRRRFP